MANHYFQFKAFRISQERSRMKVCTDSCLFGAWVAGHVQHAERILDAGSGTGLLSLMLKQQFTAAKLVAVEIDTDAAAESAENFLHSPWAATMKVETVTLEQYQSAKNFDLIIANPPFYKNSLPSPQAVKSLAMHETAFALQDWLQKMKSLLSPEGTAALLLPFHRKEEVLRLASEMQLNPYRIANVAQSDRHDSFRVMILFAKEDNTLVEEELVIRQGKDYSKEFVELLKPYYLSL